MSVLTNAGLGVKGEKDRDYETEDPEMMSQCPSIFEFLCRLRENGCVRKLASLTIKYDGGGVSLCLSCPGEGVVGFQQGKTLKSAVEGLERRLTANTMDWRERKAGEWHKSK